MLICQTIHQPHVKVIGPPVTSLGFQGNVLTQVQTMVLSINTAQEVYRALIDQKVLDGSNYPSVCDVGTGAGYGVVGLLNVTRAHKLVCIESQPGFIPRIRQTLAHSQRIELDPIQGKALPHLKRLHREKRQFDLINFGYLPPEMLNELNALLKECSQLLAPQGKVVLYSDYQTMNKARQAIERAPFQQIVFKEKIARMHSDYMNGDFDVHAAVLSMPEPLVK